MLVVTLYEDEEGNDRFKVFFVDGEDSEGQDITEQYDIFAAQTDDGRMGWTVVRKIDG